MKRIIIILSLLFSTTLSASVLQLSIIDSITGARDVNGLKVNLLYGNNLSINGINIGVLNQTLYFRGIQAGLININGDFSGIKLGAVNRSVIMRGIEFGALNTATYVRGFQVGLINYARDLRGIQLGGININLSGFPILPGINIGFSF